MGIICQNEKKYFGFFDTQTPQSTYNCQKLNTLSKKEFIEEIFAKGTWKFPCTSRQLKLITRNVEISMFLPKTELFKRNMEIFMYPETNTKT